MYLKSVAILAHVQSVQLAFRNRFCYVPAILFCSSFITTTKDGLRCDSPVPDPPRASPLLKA